MDYTLQARRDESSDSAMNAWKEISSEESSSIELPPRLRKGNWDDDSSVEHHPKRSSDHESDSIPPIPRPPDSSSSSSSDESCGPFCDPHRLKKSLVAVVSSDSSESSSSSSSEDSDCGWFCRMGQYLWGSYGDSSSAQVIVRRDESSSSD